MARLKILGLERTFSETFQCLPNPLFYLAWSRKGNKDVIDALLAPVAPQVRSCKSLSTRPGRCGRLGQATVFWTFLDIFSHFSHQAFGACPKKHCGAGSRVLCPVSGVWGHSGLWFVAPFSTERLVPHRSAADCCFSRCFSWQRMRTGYF